jgi:hypothetical protein
MAHLLENADELYQMIGDSYFAGVVKVSYGRWRIKSTESTPFFTRLPDPNHARVTHNNVHGWRRAIYSPLTWMRSVRKASRNGD